MYRIFAFLAALVGVYSIIIVIRIILSWFSGPNGVTRTPDILYRITDPYLNWWRRHLNLRVGYIDLSPIVGMAFLTVIQRILYSLSNRAIISLGGILAILLSAAWSVAAFILSFFFIIILLRLIAYWTKRNIYSNPFWYAIDTISQPILYRISRIFFSNSSNSFIKGIVVSLIVLAVLRIGGGFLIRFLSGLIMRIPL